MDVKEVFVIIYRTVPNLCLAKTNKVKHKTIHAHRTSVVRFHSMTFNIVLLQSQSSMHIPVEKKIGAA